jgi:hypothetical protein
MHFLYTTSFLKEGNGSRLIKFDKYNKAKKGKKGKKPVFNYNIKLNGAVTKK